MNLTARLYLVLSCCASLSAAAIEISLAKPYMYRKKPYQIFNTEDLNLSALLALREATRDGEPEKSQEIADAIKRKQYKKATNVVYFHPPFIYNDEVFEQLYLYQKGETFRHFLVDFLAALERSPYRAAYAKAMDRILLRINVPQTKSAKPEKPHKTRKKRLRAKAQEIVEEDAQTKRAAVEAAAPEAVALAVAPAIVPLQIGPNPIIEFDFQAWDQFELEECDKIIEAMFAPGSAL